MTPLSLTTASTSSFSSGGLPPRTCGPGKQVLSSDLKMSIIGNIFTLSKVKFFKKGHMSKVLSSLGKCVLVDKVAGCLFLIRTDLPTKKMMFLPIKPLFLKSTNNETTCIMRLNIILDMPPSDNLRELSNFPEP